MLTRRQILKIKGAKKIADELAAAGWRLEFLKHRRDFYAHGLCTHEESFGKLVGKIIVYLVGPDGSPVSLPTALFVLAHEYRHYWHIMTGKYRQYYTSDYDPLLRMLQADLGGLFKIGLKAELDCERFARSWMRKHSPSLNTGLMRRKYPHWKVAWDVLPLDLRIEAQNRIGLSEALHGAPTYLTIGQWRQRLKKAPIASFMFGDPVDLDSICSHLTPQVVLDENGKAVVSFGDEEAAPVDIAGS